MILDTNAVSALVKNEPGVRSVVIDAASFAMPVIVFAEYQFGLLGSNQRDELQPEFQRLVSACKPLPIDWVTGSCYAEIRRDLKVRGRPIPSNDLWIAALAVQHDLPILSRDTHFDAVEGVTRLGW